MRLPSWLRDFDVVDAAAAGERALLADGGQHIADLRRRQVLDVQPEATAL
jgi:hypothetical protein